MWHSLFSTSCTSGKFGNDTVFGICAINRTNRHIIIETYWSKWYQGDTGYLRWEYNKYGNNDHEKKAHSTSFRKRHLFFSSTLSTTVGGFVWTLSSSRVRVDCFVRYCVQLESCLTTIYRIWLSNGLSIANTPIDQHLIREIVISKSFLWVKRARDWHMWNLRSLDYQSTIPYRSIRWRLVAVMMSVHAFCVGRLGFV